MKEISNRKLIKLLKDRLAQVEAMQQENSSLLKQLDKLNQKLLESEEFKSHFISNVTNEIINPFASVIGLSQAIMALRGDELKKAPEMASLIYDESAFLDFQLGNIFAAARIEAGEVFPEVSSVSVGKLIDEVAGQQKHQLEKKELKLQINAPVGEALKKSFYFKTDREKLKLVLLNLLNNAIKFSSKGKHIYLSYNMQNDGLIFMIQDEGQGIDEVNLKRIFDRFHRVNKNINSLNPGNGLGLSVVQGLLYVLNAKMDIDSEVGKGTRISVIIPGMKGSVVSEDENGLFGDADGEVF